MFDVLLIIGLCYSFHDFHTANIINIICKTYPHGRLSGISPFFVDNIQMVVERIKEARYSFYNEQFDQVSQEAKEFISALLQKSPEFRLTASNALLHPWIKTLVQVGESSWPMARLDVWRLKTFNARRKWHVCLSIFYCKAYNC